MGRTCRCTNWSRLWNSLENVEMLLPAGARQKSLGASTASTASLMLLVLLTMIASLGANHDTSFPLVVKNVAGKVGLDSNIDGLLESKLDSGRRLQGATGGKACDGSLRPERLAGNPDGVTTTLDFTGGYVDRMDCAWMLSCEGGNATALRFTSFDTESDFDFVSLVDGDGHNKITVDNGLSGSIVPSGTYYAAKDGVMAIGFRSDDSVTADGFAAEYWCVDGAAVGCTDKAATNYELGASIDDGSCIRVLAGNSDGVSTTLDFTGGYANNTDGAWMLSCEGGNATALRFTSFDTESDFDFVSLVDGDGHKITVDNGLSGSIVPSGTYAAKDGVMEIGFRSDDSVTADGFAAEYWCVDGAAVGCTDMTAANYNSRATADDGSCVYVTGCTDPAAANYDHRATVDDSSCRDGAEALRAAFGVAAATSEFARLRGWADGLNPCGHHTNDVLTEYPWEGLTCDSGYNNQRVTGIWLTGRDDLGGFVLGPAICNLTALTSLALHDTLLSGTMPGCLGRLSALGSGADGINVENTLISGTIPDSFGRLSNARTMNFHNTRLSGSIPASFLNSTFRVGISLMGTNVTAPDESGQGELLRSAFGVNLRATWGDWRAGDPCYKGWHFWTGIRCTNGQVTEIKLNGRSDLSCFELTPAIGSFTGLTELSLHDTQLSGTMPSALGSLIALTELNLHRTRLSGTIPDSIGALAALTNTRLSDTKLSGTIPESLGRLTILSCEDASGEDTCSANLAPTLQDPFGEWSCEEDYCPSCPQAGECDASCGFCDGERLDFDLHGSPGLSGTIPAGFCAATVDLHGCALIGAGAGDLTSCHKLTILDLSSNSVTSLPPKLPPGLTHLYLGSNPIATTAAELSNLTHQLPHLVALDIAFLAVGVDLSATRVTVPSGCRLGPDPPDCVFELQLVDDQGQPIKVGGLKPDLALGVAGLLTQQIEDELAEQPAADQPAGSAAAARSVSPSAMYVFSGDLDDSTGIAHGTATGNVILVADRFGVSNEAYAFDGTGFITVPSPFARGSDEFSLAIWLCPSAVNDASWHGFAGSQELGTRGPSLWVNWGSGNTLSGSTVGEDFGLLYDTRTLQYGDGTRFSGVIDSWFEANTYVHTVWTGSAGSNTFYKNGAVAPGGTVAGGDQIDHVDDYHIGKVDMSSQMFSGTVDEVLFYTMALSASDVEFLYFHGANTMDIGTTGSAVRQPMIDMGNGRYTVVVPAAAAPARATDSLAVFFSDDESVFHAGYDGGGVNVGWEQLRRVQYGTAHCDLAATHTVADPTTGAFCVCADGFEPDTATTTSDVIVSSLATELRCHKPQCSFGHWFDTEASVCLRCPPWAICPGGPRELSLLTSCPPGQQPDSDGLSCAACPSGRATTGRALCMPCGLNQEPDVTGIHCVCTFGHYNSSAVAGGRKMQCLSHDWQHSADAEITCVSCAGLGCARCGHGVAVLAGWQALRTPHVPANVFRCPLPDGCLDGGRGCAVGYTGILCGVCDIGYDLIDQSCTLCTETGTSTALTFLTIFVVGFIVWVGIRFKSTWGRADARSTGLRATLTTENPMVGGDYIRENFDEATTKRPQSQISWLFRIVYHPGRIMIGFFQVVTQIGPVLHLDFPENMQRLLDALRPLAADLQSLLQIKCLGELGFYSIWVIRNLIIPLLLAGGVLLWYSYERRRLKADVASERCRGNLFVVTFLIYPGVCNRTFSVFNCRPLSDGIRVLHEDYSIDCGTNAHTLFQILAAVIAIGFSAGVPLALIVALVKRARAHNTVTPSERFVARRVAEELQMDDKMAIDAVNDIGMGRDYSFLVNAYQPRYFFWEGIDMIRKLAMVGLLVIAGQGSVSQIFVGLCLSVGSLGAQLRFAPYKHAQDNDLKLLTEVAIFLTLLVAFALKAEPARGSGELLSTTTYDILLVGLFAVVLPAAFVATVWSEQGQMRQALVLANADGAINDVSERRRAIKLFQLGIASGTEVRLLADYIGKLDFIVNRTMHVFISYRVAADAELARTLYEQLSARALVATGQKIRVYLDVIRLEDGQRWDQGFMSGLAGSMIFVPIISVGALRPMLDLGKCGENPDYMLVEWVAALELQQRGAVKAVFPIFVAAIDNLFDEAEAAFGGISRLPDQVPDSTLERVGFHLGETTGDSSTDKLHTLMGETTGVGETTVRSTIVALLKFQGCKMSYSDSKSVKLCVSRVHALVEGCMHRVGTKEEGEPTSPGHHLKAFGAGEL